MTMGKFSEPVPSADRLPSLVPLSVLQNHSSHHYGQSLFYVTVTRILAINALPPRPLGSPCSPPLSSYLMVSQNDSISR